MVVILVVALGIVALGIAFALGAPRDDGEER